MPFDLVATEPQPLLRVSACPHPFDGRRIDYVMAGGLTIAEIVDLIQPDPLLRAHGVAFIGDHMIAREHWHRVRPKSGALLSIRLLPSSGRTAAMIGLAVLVIAVAIAAPYLAPVLVTGATATGALGVALGAGAAALVSIGGTLLINHFLPAPVPELSKDYGKDKPTYAITGQRNRADPWGKLPFLCGRFKQTPPYAALPYREAVGGDIYWRALFALGHGPINIEEMRVGETLLSNFQGVDVEFRRGYWSMPAQGDWNAATGVFPSNPSFGHTWTCSVSGTTDGQSYRVGETITFNGLAAASSAAAWDRDQGKPFALFPNDVFEDPLAAAVTHATPVVRASQASADELSVELVFDRGLVHIQNVPAGKRSDTSAAVRIEQSPTGQNQWTTVIEQTITGRQVTPLFWGHRWKTIDFGVQDAVKQYDVRVSRLSGDMDEDRNFGNFSWYALRTFTTGSPVPTGAVAMLALRIKSSGQLTGSIDEFNFVGQTIARDWDAASQTWVWRPTSSPAALFRHVLQHPTRQTPTPDSQIDLARLAYWDGVTRPAGRNFNGVFEAKGSLYDALIKIGRVGRAMPTLRDLMYSVVIDEPKTAPVRLFTPRNSWNYSSEMTHAATPHAYRIGFVNSAKDWTTQEVVVYDDGYGEASATRVDRVEWPGVYDHDQAFKEGRFHLAQQRLRRGVHKLTVDFEQLVCERGDLVAVQHDAVAVGLGTGRIVARSMSGTTVLDVTLDTPMVMQTGKTYGFRARRIISGVQRTDLYRVNTVVGTTPKLTFTSPPAEQDAPQVGDLVAFGELNREIIRLLVRDIEPKTDLSAMLTLIEEAAGVHTAEVGPIPPYDPVVTAPNALPAPTVLSIASDERVMLVTPSRTLIERVIFTLAPITIDGAQLIIFYRLQGTDANWQQATVQQETATTVIVTGLQSGETYDFRLLYRHSSYLSSPATTVNAYYVIGRTNPPADLQNLTIAVVGGQALLRWDLPADLDVQVGGWIMFRHSPDMNATLWPNSTSIAQAVTGDQTHVYAPLKPGTYFARVYDADGRPSSGFSYVSTKQASVLAFASVDDLQEDPTFSGTKTNCEVVDDGLMLSGSDWDSVPDVDALPEWDIAGGNAAVGLYEFAAGLDLTTVTRARITSHVKLEAVNEFDYWDSKIGNIDTWPDVDGTLGASVDAQVYGKLTDDDPAGTPTWSAFTRVDSLEINARAIGELECRLTCADPAFNLWLTELRISADGVS